MTNLLFQLNLLCLWLSEFAENQASFACTSVCQLFGKEPVGG